MILCFDIGGSWIKTAVAQSADRIDIGPRYPTPASDFGAFSAILSRVLQEQAETPGCIAISMTGVVDPDWGVITCANIPCIDQRPLQRELEAALDVPVLIANDADCFALAEAGRGAGQGHRIVFGIILGSGVGGGLVVNGRLVNETGGYAGEWGHGPAIAAFAGDPPVSIPAFPCSCGQKGCVNTVGGARGLERLHRHIHGDEQDSTAIVEAWERGDDKAARTVDIYVDLVASPLALAVNITGASIVPAGGGLSNSETLIDKIDQSVRSRILRKQDRPLVVRAGCEVEPGLIGAAMLGLGYRRNG